MKRKVLTLVVGFCLALAVTGHAQTQTETARDAALAFAGVSADTVENLQIREDTQDDIAIHHVTFRSNIMTYKVEISQADGRVLSYSCKPHGATQGMERIEEAQAEAIALAQAGLTPTSSTVIKITLEKEDGLEVYEVLIQDGDITYTLELDAETGLVLDYELDTRHSADATSSATPPADTQADEAQEAAKQDKEEKKHDEKKKDDDKKDDDKKDDDKKTDEDDDD